MLYLWKPVPMNRVAAVFAFSSISKYIAEPLGAGAGERPLRILANRSGGAEAGRALVHVSASPILP